MTETKDREEIDLRTLAGKFAEGDKSKARVWLKTLSEAVKAGTLQAREERRLLPGVSRRPVTTGFTTFAGMTAREVFNPPPSPPIETRRYWFTRAAVAAWLGKVEAPPLVHIWIGEARQATQAPESAGSEKPRKKANRQTGRRDRLRVAMESGLQAYRERHKAEPTSGDLFDWLAKHDETEVITEYTDEYLWWKPSEGPEKKIDRKAFAKRMTAIRANSPR